MGIRTTREHPSLGNPRLKTKDHGCQEIVLLKGTASAVPHLHVRNAASAAEVQLPSFFANANISAQL
jgi:hypothetical protein